MYQFNIVKNEDSSWRFDLDGISLILDGYTIENEKHLMNNPDKAVAFFNVDGMLYGVTNQPTYCTTAEDFYDVMIQQYAVFKGSVRRPSNALS